jgi:DNA-binding TFAR19-related protein (PDSD5 family)
LSSDDKILELLKRRKLIELSRMASSKETKLIESASKIENPREVLAKILVDRGLEVLEAAESQYPEITREIEKLIVQLILSGKLRESITGEQLYWLFHRLGINVRLKTRIRILEHGELKTIEEKIKGQ